MAVLLTFNVDISRYALIDTIPGGQYYKKYVKRYSLYRSWLRSVGGRIVEFNPTEQYYQIEFENEEDAILFKLKYL